MAIFSTIGALLSGAKFLGAISSTKAVAMNNWKFILVALLAGVIFYQNFVTLELLKFTGMRTIPGLIQDHTDEVNDLEATIKQCTLDKEKLKGAIDATNAQIDKWANVSGQLQAQHDALVGEISLMRDQSAQAVQDILEGPPPEGCEASIQYLKDNSQIVKWN